MAEIRSPIPDPVQRDVRQRCGFGCVLCGAPLYEYHHMDLNRENNIAANITLLCDTHHKEATNNLLTPDQIATANASPYNIRHGVSSPYGLHFQGDRFDCVIGGNSFSSRLRDGDETTWAIAISVDDTDLLWFRIDSGGRLFLNATILDENNLPLLVIRDNALVYRTATWDIEFKGHVLTFRAAAGKILFEIDFIPPGRIVINRARLLCNGIEILVRKSHVYIVNSQGLLVRNESADNDIGLQFGRNERGLAAGFSCDPTKLSRYLLPAQEKEQQEREVLKRMKKTMASLGVAFDL